jgi:hypothetical protein
MAFRSIAAIVAGAVMAAVCRNGGGHAGHVRTVLAGGHGVVRGGRRLPTMAFHACASRAGAWDTGERVPLQRHCCYQHPQQETEKYTHECANGTAAGQTMASRVR